MWLRRQNCLETLIHFLLIFELTVDLSINSSIGSQSWIKKKLKKKIATKFKCLFFLHSLCSFTAQSKERTKLRCSSTSFSVCAQTCQYFEAAAWPDGELKMEDWLEKPNRVKRDVQTFAASPLCWSPIRRNRENALATEKLKFTVIPTLVAEYCLNSTDKILYFD